MWLFTTTGFFSVVQKPNDDNLTVRARVRADLDALREKYLPELSATIEASGSDYPYRASVSHEHFARALGKLASDLHYSNFKNEVARAAGAKREQTYHAVWQNLLELERDEG